jgi:hypothetical protein
VSGLALATGPLAAGESGNAAAELGLVPAAVPPAVSSMEPLHVWPDQRTDFIPATSYGCAVQFLLGMEDGFRFQYALCRDERRAWLAEAFAGVGGAAGVGGFACSVGGRYQFAPADGPRNAFLMAPGARAMFVSDAWSEDNFSLATDVTFSWLHKRSADFAWETGVNLGVTVGLAGEGRGAVGPLFGIFTGFRH